MTESDKKVYIEDLFENIVESLKKVKSKNMEYKIDSNSRSLITSEFILTFNNEEYIFILTFFVGQVASNVAIVMLIILKYLETNEITILEDSFYDKDENKILFGPDAIHKKNNEILKITGNNKCFVCDKITPTILINKDNICKSCETIYSKILWC